MTSAFSYLASRQGLAAAFAGVGLLWGIFAAATAAADVIVLTNDGRVQGTLVNANESPRKNYVVKTGAGEITIDKSQVKEVILQSPAEEEYERVRFTFADTVEEQWKLAEWCRDSGLTRQRTTHLERVIELDPNHKSARAALGYSRMNGGWFRQEDVMKQRGYVWHKGKWMLPQDIEIQEQKRKTETAQKGWYLKLKQLRAQLDDRGPRAETALAEMKKLADPNALAAIADMFRSERSAGVQGLLMDAMARIKTPDAVRVLADIALENGNEEVRLSAVDRLKEIKSPAAVTYFVQQLNGKDNVRINRAGTALGELGDKSAIGPLIDALVTVHKAKVQQGGNNTFSPSFDSQGGIGFGAGGKTVTISKNVANRDVLDGLIKLADGPDHGYDQQAWSRWHAGQKKPAPAPGRRD
jgi:hypothetical protein